VSNYFCVCLNDFCVFELYLCQIIFNVFELFLCVFELLSISHESVRVHCYLAKRVMGSNVSMCFQNAYNKVNQAEELKRIAQEAIQNVNKMTTLLENNRTSPSTTQNSSASVNNSALSELQRRFPTLNSRSTTSMPCSRSSRGARFRPYQSTAGPGRPLKSSFVTRDVIIIEK